MAFSNGKANATSHARESAPRSSARRASGVFTPPKLARMGHLADASPDELGYRSNGRLTMIPRRTLDRVTHVVAGVGPLLFFGVATAEGFLRAGYDPIALPI